MLWNVLPASTVLVLHRHLSFVLRKIFPQARRSRCNRARQEMTKPPQADAKPVSASLPELFACLFALFFSVPATLAAPPPLWLPRRQKTGSLFFRTTRAMMDTNSLPDVGPFSRDSDGPVRVLHFLRHGHYARSPESKDIGLSARGREQVLFAARSLACWPVEAVYSSTLPRAVESASIVCQELNLSPAPQAEILCEIPAELVGDVYVPMGGHPALQQKLKEIQALYLQPAERTRHEVIVAHGNLIRLLFCFFLQSHPDAWLQMRIYHAGITRFLVLSDGAVRLAGFNEIGYLPENLVSEV